MGGLVAAAAIARCKDIEIDLYESAPAFNETGAGIVMWRRPYLAMKEMGMEGVVAEAVRIPAESDDSTQQFPIPSRRSALNISSSHSLVPQVRSRPGASDL